MKLEIHVPDVAHIKVSAPVGAGSSLVLSRLEEVLRTEFGAQTVMNDELKSGYHEKPQKAQKWERDVVKRTIWVLSE